MTDSQSDDSRLDFLLDAYILASEEGQEVTLEELCPNDSRLRELLGERIQAWKAAQLLRVSVSDGDETPEGSRLPVAAEGSSLSIGQFRQRLNECGLASSEEVQALLDCLPPEELPTDGIALSELLVRRQLLTAFQAREICNGNGRSLLWGNLCDSRQTGTGRHGRSVQG